MIVKPKLKTMKILKLLIFLVCSATTAVNAQKSLAGSGGTAEGNAGTISYSVGQLFYSSQTSADANLTQDVQQPYEISVLIGLNESPEIRLRCEVYPNPATEKLNLLTEADNQAEYSAILTDQEGRLLRQISITSNETSINLNGFNPAVYYLTVFRKPLNGNTKAISSRITIKSFKIIKL